MDLALALPLAEGAIMTSGAKLGAASLSQLVQQCRLTKERAAWPKMRGRGRGGPAPAPWRRTVDGIEP